MTTRTLTRAQGRRARPPGQRRIRRAGHRADGKRRPGRGRQTLPARRPRAGRDLLRPRQQRRRRTGHRPASRLALDRRESSGLGRRRRGGPPTPGRITRSSSAAAFRSCSSTTRSTWPKSWPGPSGSSMPFWGPAPAAKSARRSTAGSRRSMPPARQAPRCWRSICPADWMPTRASRPRTRSARRTPARSWPPSRDS